MVTQVSGTRDGEEWPPAGETVDVSEEEAEALVAAGVAQPADAPYEAPAQGLTTASVDDGDHETAEDPTTVSHARGRHTTK
jgi:hypothetical protein